MRNLIEHPITADEVILCLNTLANEIEAIEPVRFGDLRPTILRSAALTIEHVSHAGLVAKKRGVIEI